jgi:hypothetical protein
VRTPNTSDRRGTRRGILTLPEPGGRAKVSRNGRTSAVAAEDVSQEKRNGPGIETGSNGRYVIVAALVVGLFVLAVILSMRSLRAMADLSAEDGAHRATSGRSLRAPG